MFSVKSNSVDLGCSRQRSSASQIKNRRTTLQMIIRNNTINRSSLLSLRFARWSSFKQAVSRNISTPPRPGVPFVHLLWSVSCLLQEMMDGFILSCGDECRRRSCSQRGGDSEASVLFLFICVVFLVLTGQLSLLSASCQNADSALTQNIQYRFPSALCFLPSVTFQLNVFLVSLLLSWQIRPNILTPGAFN